MTKVESLKILCAQLRIKEGESITPEEIPGDTIDEIILEIAKIYGYVEKESGTLGALTLSSIPGSTAGTSKITVSGNTTNNFKYAIGSKAVPPAYHDNLSSWASWDGTSDITIDDGVKICIAEVNSSGLAEKAGVTSVNSNVS